MLLLMIHLPSLLSHLPVSKSCIGAAASSASIRFPRATKSATITRCSSFIWRNRATNTARCFSPQAAQALERLCHTYWYPLYAYVRRLGYGHEDAQDLTPVETVSWDGAVAFCKQASAKTGKQFRLPSETEWEYSCRAGSKTRYFFGD